MKLSVPGICQAGLINDMKVVPVCARHADMLGRGGMAPFILKLCTR
jgi:hypothetical protein